MIDLSIKLVNHYERLLGNADGAATTMAEFDEDDLMQMDQAKPRLFQGWREEVFGEETLLDRNEFIKRVARFGNWIF
jgi:hypothetical protein